MKMASVEPYIYIYFLYKIIKTHQAFKKLKEHVNVVFILFDSFLRKGDTVKLVIRCFIRY